MEKGCGKRFKAVKGTPQANVDLCGSDHRKALSTLVDRDVRCGFRAWGITYTDDSGKWRFLRQHCENV